MNYQRIYNQIVNNRVCNVVDGYTERHHIIPRSFGGTDDTDNIVALTAREHFLCHWLLIKMYPTGALHHKAIQAFMMMACTSKDHGGNRITSRLFEKYKIEHSKAMSFSQKGQKNSQYGMVWYHNIELKESKKFSAGYVPIGWTKGRVINWELYFQKQVPKDHIKISSNKYSWIELEADQILNEFDTHKSITKILRKRGFVGREGNKILSRWLTANGRVPLRRRNTAPKA